MGLYESETQEVIQRRMLERVPAKFDKREGSIIFDSTAPASVELQNNYIALDTVLDETFADTSSREYLIRRCAEHGVTPKPASYAKVQGKFTPATLEIPVGTRFSHDDLNYIVTEKIVDGLYYLQCETAGSVANGVTGRLIPIDYVNGLETAEIIEVSVLGDDEEDTEALRARFFESVRSESFGGNERDYKDKILSISGVGGCKIYGGSEWNGGSTVLIVVQDSAMGVPTDGFISDIQTMIDPEMNTGEGKGLAPFGHFVTVVPVDTTTINIETSIIYNTGASWETIGQKVKDAVDAYLAGLNERWQNNDHIVVRIAHLESALLDIPGVLDIQNTIINGVESNFGVDKNSLVTRGTINGN